MGHEVPIFIKQRAGSHSPSPTATVEPNTDIWETSLTLPCGFPVGVPGKYRRPISEVDHC